MSLSGMVPEYYWVFHPIEVSLGGYCVVHLKSLCHVATSPLSFLKVGVGAEEIFLCENSDGKSPYDYNGKVWKALYIRDCLELPTSPVARRNKDNFTQFQKSQSCQHLDRGLVASRTWGKSLLFLSCTRWPIPYYGNTCAALCKGVHLVSAYMMQMRGPVLYCSLSLRFCGKLINMIQKRQHTNAEALTLNPHPLLFSVIAPNYLIGSL